MRTKLRITSLGAVIQFLFWVFFITLAGAQTDPPVFSQQDSVSPLNCTAPIYPDWLKVSKKDAARAVEHPMVRVAYLIPSNRTAQPLGVDALQLVIRTGRDFFKDHMVYNGLDPKTFRYETEVDGETPLIHVVHIQETDEQILEGTDGNRFTNTVNAAINAGLSIWHPGEIWLLVAEAHVQQSDGTILVGGGRGLGGGSADDPGVATMESTFLTPLAQGGLTDNRPYHGLFIPEIGPFPLQQGVFSPNGNGSTISSLASVNLGAYLHELMHAFGIIPHDFRNDNNFHGNLMGNGFRGIRGTLYPNRYPSDYTRLAYVSAQVLNTSHYFNANKVRNTIDHFHFESNISPRDGKLVFRVEVSDSDGLSLLRLTGPDATGVEKVISGNQFNDEIKTPYFVPGITNSYRLHAYDQQGNKVDRHITLIPQSGNRAPWPFMRFMPPVGEAGQSFELDANPSIDPDGNHPLSVEWDFNNDDVFDTPPMQGNLSSNINLSAGNHLIKSRITDSSGLQTESTPIALHVEGEIPPISEITFTLIDAVNNQPIPAHNPLVDGAELDLLSIPSKLSIRANTPNGTESVRFDFDGTKASRVENVSPYALFGDNGGDYFPGMFTVGKHNLVAQAFSGDNASGQAIAEGAIHFRVLDNTGFFELIDAKNGQFIGFIRDDIKMDFSQFANRDVTVITPHTMGVDNLKVLFKLSGPLDRTWIENYFPYTLFGDDNGSFNGEQFSVGDYNLKAFFAFGEDQFDMEHPNIETDFSIKPATISGLLFSSETYSSQFRLIENGRTYFPQLGEFAGDVSIRANTSSKAGSLVLKISGPINHNQIENIQPYYLFGDIPGEETPNARPFPEGDYTLTATPYTEPDGQGIAGESLTISFRIEITEVFSILNLFMLDAATGNFIVDLRSDSGGVVVINPTETQTTNVNILAEHECDFGPCIESVEMILQGPLNISRIENEGPFMLFGDINGQLFGQDLPPGNYTLTATAYSEDDATGVKGKTLSTEFIVLDPSDPLVLKTSLYPNPTHSEVFIENTAQKNIISGQIFDMSGKEVLKIPVNWDGQTPLDVSSLKQGIYIVRIQNGGEQVTKKLVVQ